MLSWKKRQIVCAITEKRHIACVSMEKRQLACATTKKRQIACAITEKRQIVCVITEKRQIACVIREKRQVGYAITEKRQIACVIMGKYFRSSFLLETSEKILCGTYKSPYNLWLCVVQNACSHIMNMGYTVKELLWLNMNLTEAVVRRCSVEKVKFTGKHLCQSLFFKACNFIKKETLKQVFSCEFCEISKSNFFYRTPPMAASDLTRFYRNCCVIFPNGQLMPT